MAIKKGCGLFSRGDENDGNVGLFPGMSPPPLGA
jgi:hypothetical protein